MLKTIRNLDYMVLLCDNRITMRAFYHDIRGLGDWFEMQVGAVLLTPRQRGR